MDVATWEPADLLVVDNVRADAYAGTNVGVQVRRCLEEFGITLPYFIAPACERLAFGVFEHDVLRVARYECLKIAGVVRLNLSLDGIHAVPILFPCTAALRRHSGTLARAADEDARAALSSDAMQRDRVTWLFGFSPLVWGILSGLAVMALGVLVLLFATAGRATFFGACCILGGAIFAGSGMYRYFRPKRAI